MINGEDVALLNNTNATENGVYDYSDDGITYTLTRRSDMNDDADVQQGMFFWIKFGATLARTGWMLVSPNPVILGTSNLTFVETPIPGGGALANPYQIYVDIEVGDDATGDGSVTNPFKTIPAALAAALAGPTGNYVLELASGTYSGAPIAWPVTLNKNISINGAGVEITVIDHVISYTSLGLSDEFLVFNNVAVSNQIVFDLALASVAFVILANGRYSVQRIDTLPPGPQFIKIINSYVDGFDTASIIYMSGCQFIGGTNIVQPTGLVLMNQVLFDSMAVQVDGSMALLSTIAQNTTFTGMGTLSSDASSLVGTIIAGPTVSYFDLAENVGYTPAVPANWSVVPTQVKQALDLLAANTQTALPNVYYVAKNGNDITGDGSIANPFLTVGKAATEIGNATSNADFNDVTKRYYEINVSPGVYAENVTFGCRPFILLNLERASIQGDVTIQMPQGTIFGAGLQSPKFIIKGSDVRGVAGGQATIGVIGNVIYESTVSGSSLVAVLEVMNAAINGGITQQLGVGGGVFTLTLFLSNAIVTGTIANNSGAGSMTLYADNCDDSSSNAIGAVNGVINLNVLSNIRFNGPVDVNSSQSGRWFNVEFKSGQAHDFTGSLGTISADANSYQSYFANVPVKGAEIFNLLDNARGVAYNPAAPLNWLTPPTEVKAALDELASRISGLNISFDAVKFVAKNGNDATGTGSITKPYLTVKAAMDSILDATNLRRYAIFVNPGRYDEVGLTLSANVFIIGYSYFNTRISNSIPFAPNATFTPAGDHRSGIVNINIASAINMDFLAISSNEGKFYLNGCQVTSTLTFTSFSSINQGFVDSCEMFSGVTNNGFNLHMRSNRVFGGNIVLNSQAGRTTRLDMLGCKVVGNLTAIGDGVNPITARLTGNNIAGSITASGAGVAISSDVISAAGTKTITAPATFTFLSFAQNLGFTPNVAGDWSPSPTEVKAALDQLSGRRTIVEYHTITAPELAAKQFTLSKNPLSLTNVAMHANGGSLLVNGVAFQVVAPNIIDWNGFTLDGFIMVGDKFELIYDAQT